MAPLIYFTACNSTTSHKNSPTTTDTLTATEPMVGADRDKHNCIASAGYTWSAVKQNCVRIFEEGIRLNPTVVNKQEAVLCAFIIEAKTNDSLELYLPNENNGEGIICKTFTNEKNAWLYSNFVIVKNNNKYTIYHRKIDAHDCTRDDLAKPHFLQSLLNEAETLYTQN